MKPNPGGEIPPDEVIGRDALVERLWRVLDRQGLVLTAERRVGKTCLIKKMCHAPPPGKIPVLRDLEKVHTAQEFAETVLGDVVQYLSRLNKAARRVRDFLSPFGGMEVGGVIRIPKAAAEHWKTLLASTIEDLVEHQEHTVILFWDELPLMLHNIKQREGERVAMEALDLLRALRQTHARLRMVFTGSIGLHHVITKLKREGYLNPSTNDMLTEDVPPLPREDAIDLAMRLLDGGKVTTTDRRGVAAAIAAGVDHIPYYIHHVVDQMVDSNASVDVRAVEQIVIGRLTDPQDRWELAHYRDRIDVYYEQAERPLILAALDALAAAREPLSFEDVFNLVKAQVVTEDRDLVRELLMLLQRDHYLVQDADGRYRFLRSLLQRWWRIRRGLV